MLGFTLSCGTLSAYGTPSAHFVVKGQVTSSNTDKAINNIKVMMEDNIVYTDANGKYQVTDRNGFPKDQTYTVQFLDDDGLLNGEFQNKDTSVVFKDPEFSGGDGDWFEGTTTETFDVKLAPKE